jgi:arylsulfatase A-like enzyme
VVVTADHGEEFDDHGGFEHGHTVYDELLHVPLIMRFPPRVKPGTVSAVARHIDIAPTFCALAGIDIPPNFQGESLSDVISGASTRSPATMAETEFWGELLVAWRHGGYKVVRTPGAAELYHVAVDPKERENLADREAERLGRSLAELEEARAVLAKVAGPTAALSAEQRQRLITIGYLTDEDGADQPKTPAEGE